MTVLLTTSPAGRAAIMQREGVRLTAYQDTRGIWTIGVGHTPAYAGQTITQEQADSILSADLARFEECVNRVVKVPLSQNEFDACVSLAFNIGTGGFTGSSVVRMLNDGYYESAADDFLMWEIPPELKKRREGERAQFLAA